MNLKHFFIFIFLCFGKIAVYTQTTTFSLGGQVLDEHKEPLLGATVVAVRKDSKTQYATVVNAQGKYQIQGMRSGGPYRIEFMPNVKDEAFRFKNKRWCLVVSINRMDLHKEPVLAFRFVK